MPQIQDNQCPAVRQFTRPTGGLTMTKPAAGSSSSRCVLTAEHHGLHLTIHPFTSNPIQFAEVAR
jgi:hypothetical protein